jgi:hypothetical protein
MLTKSHIHKTYGTLNKTSFCTKEYAEIHIQRSFFDIEKAYGKFLYWKSKWCAHALVQPLHMEAIFFEKNQNLNFQWNFKASWTYCLWADFGSLRQFWAYFAILAVADSMPKLDLKS